MQLDKFSQCVDIALRNKKISREVADAILASDNPNETIDELLGDYSRQRRETAIQAVRFSQAMADIESHPNGPYHGLMALMSKDTKGVAAYNNVEYLGRFYEGKYHSKWAESMSRFRTRMFGLTQDEEGLNKLIKAIYGEAVDDPDIEKFARQWHELSDEMRNDFNARGGSISKNERWLMPQRHDASAINKLGRKQWKEDIIPLLDRDNMLDDNGKALSDEQFDAMMDYVFETITTGGLNKVKEMSVPMMGKKLSRKGSESRVLYFKNAETWMEYQNKYGKGDVFTTLTDHINSMANDVALMERMGTNPESTYLSLRAMLDKEDTLSQTQKAMSNALFNVISGKLNQGELTTLADVAQSTSNILVAAKLGAAMLSAISDVGYQAVTARYNNIPAYKVLARQMSQMNPANEADRIFAAKIGLISDSAKKQLSGNRYSDTYGVGKSAKAAEFVMRASLLEPWTNAGRKAFGMEFSSLLAENFGKSVDELDPILQNRFKAYGITEDDWNVFSKTAPVDYKGAKFADMLQERGDKFHRMVMSETDYAVPTPDARVRAITTGGTARNTVTGQGVRAIMMLKSFSITMAMTHLQRAAFQTSGAQKLEYIGLLAASTTLFGGLSVQAKDLAAGREPRDMTTPEFWGAAFLQGGGLGIFGDYLFSDVNRFGGGPVQSAFGPKGEMVEKAFRLTLGNVQEALSGEETNVLGETIDFAKRYSPSVWQVQLFKNAMFDQAQLLADPNAQKKYNRIVRRRQKDYQQGYWWKPGEALPEALQ